ncbi:NAP1-related protein 1-like isoform X2 [Papaver somniferum]|uniref:NAP1-related protein 1-like isoform X2 n=1 Tax=Papaver somniferum TaxID=3469 RepID=UPI000E702A71|nr:NAP1-related protein 1-like isoform X2 [Papaver somniferum]
MILGIRKYLDKYERLSEMKIPKKSMRIELIQKEKADLEEWKKVAAISRVDLDLVESLEKLMQVQHKLDRVKKKTVLRIRNLKDTCKKELWEIKVKQQQQDDRVQAHLYKQRGDIIKSIPKFWSTAFTGDYSLQRRLNKVDKKIIKFLNSVVVEGRPEVASECTIILNFDENEYFDNSSLTKTISFSYKGINKVSGTTINWKSGKGITAGLEEKWSEQSHTDVHKSFFTWFSEGCTKKLHDPVVNALASDLWRYAPDYFYMPGNMKSHHESQ